MFDCDISFYGFTVNKLLLLIFLSGHVCYIKKVNVVELIQLLTMILYLTVIALHQV